MSKFEDDLSGLFVISREKVTCGCVLFKLGARKNPAGIYPFFRDNLNAQSSRSAKYPEGNKKAIDVCFLQVTDARLTHTPR